MAEDDSQGRDGRKGHDDLRSKLLTRLLTPIAAAGASAVAGYAVKKAPDMFERMLPRLRSLAGDAGDATRELPGRAASVASNAGDVAQELGDRAKSLVTSTPLTGGGGGNGNGRGRSDKRSLQEFEQRRDERARARAERRKAAS